MSDLVKRLREHQTKYMTPVLSEAADEIERLRLALRKISNCGQSADPDHWKFRQMARETARDALSNKEGQADE